VFFFLSIFRFNEFQESCSVILKYLSDFFYFSLFLGFIREFEESSSVEEREKQIEKFVSKARIISFMLIMLMHLPNCFGNWKYLELLIIS
jgi:hypothetical protein